MSNLTLTAQTPLNGFSQRFDGIEVSELQGYSLVSMAFSSSPLGDDKKTALDKNIKAAFKTNLPSVGKFTVSSVDNTHILGLQLEQCFVLFENPEVYAHDNAVAHIQQFTQDKAYLSDQSDSWAILKISGERCREALERICMIDLNANNDLHNTTNLHSTTDTSSFNTFSVTRTVMEHLAVIIMQTNDNEYLLFSPRSSAESFLHMILTSIENIS